MLDLQPLYYGTSTFPFGQFGGLGTLPTYRTLVETPLYDLDFQFGATSTDLSNAGFVFSRSGTAWDEFGNSYSASTPRIVPGKGWLVGGARTNSLRNNTMVGAVAGTPGTLPTNWVATAATGLSYQVVGTGTLGGLTYLDLRIYGTAGSTSSTAVAPESTTQVAASNGQSWTGSWHLALVGGSLANVTGIALEVTERDSGGSALATTSGSDIRTSLTANLQRFALGRTCNNASTAAVLVKLTGSVTNGAAVDYTLRIAAPQLEQGAFMSSPILTSTAAVTRSVESCSATRTAAYLSQGTLVVELQTAVGMSTGVNQIVYRSGSTNRVVLFRDGTSGALTFGGTGVTPSSNSLGAPGSSATTKVALAWNSSRVAASRDGAAVVATTAGSLTAPDGAAEHLGNYVSANEWFGYVRRIRRYATVFSDAALQLATAGYELNLAYDATAADLAAAGFTTTRATAGWDELGRSYASGAPRLVPGRGLLVEGARTSICLRSQELDNASWTKTNSTVTANQILAPDGTLTADHVTRGSTANGYLQQVALSLTAGSTYTASVYAKVGTLGGKLGLRLATTHPARVDGVFDLATGAVLFSAANTWTGISTSSVAIGGGWYRFSVTGTADATTASGNIVLGPTDLSTATWEGTNTVVPNCYVWQAQVSAASFSGTPIVTTSASVTRNVDAIVATRPAGQLDRGSVVVRAALAPGSDSGVQQMLLTLHDGTVDNRLSLYRSTSTSALSLFLGSGGAQQAALAGAAGSANALAISGGAGRWATDYVGWSVNGGAVTVDAVATVPAMTSEQLGARNGNAEPLHGYLRRIKRTTSLLTDAELLAASNGYDLPFALGATASDLAGAGWSYSRAGTAFDRWGNSYPANQPRIVAGYGILLEGSRTNLALQSSTFSSGSWTKTELTLTAAAGTSPDGTASAWSMVESAASASRTMQQGISFTSGTSYCLSLYVKALPGSVTRYARILLPAGAFGASSLGANFDLSTGVATNVGAGVTTTAVSIGGGWRRISVAATATSSATSNVILAMAPNTLGTSNYAGDGTSGMLVWQAQCEAGAFASTPIPTTSSTVTRAADVLTASRAAGLLTQGSVLIEATTPVGLDASTSAALYSAYIDAATYLWAYRGTGRAIGVDSQAGGLAFSTVADSTHLRVACTWTSTGFKACLNGGTVQTGTGSGAFTTEALGDLPPYGRPFFGNIRRIARTGEAWSDAQLKAFTFGAVL